MQRQPGRATADSALDFLRSRIDYERTASIPYGQRDFHLDRMRDLMARLGNPHHALSIVHVAGTKGKGSTAATIASMLQAAGLRTGLYSSPHLDRVEERLMIDGQQCSSEDLIDLVRRIEPAVAEMDALADEDSENLSRPTYFEIITSLALMRFAEQRVDAAVLEVGLGGRLDSTNICQPRVSVITSISYDHMQQLGNTLAEIAGEKAGIIKDRIPVVSGVIAEEPRAVIERVAQQHGARLIQLGENFDFDYRAPRHLESAAACGQMDFSSRVDGVSSQLNNLELNLMGVHQAANAAVAIATAEELRRQGWPISDTAIRTGLAQTKWPARIEVLRRRPTVILDSAHNVASIEALVRVLDESFSAPTRLLVFATTRDKDVQGMLGVLVPKFDAVILTRYRNNPRGVPPQELDRLAGEFGATRRYLCGDSVEAWQLAQQLATPQDLICITGSFFIAAEMRAAMKQDDLGR